jgi:hypothetical protein
MTKRMKTASSTKYKNRNQRGRSEESKITKEIPTLLPLYEKENSNVGESENV